MSRIGGGVGQYATGCSRTVEICGGAATLIVGIMTGLNQVQPFAPLGDPVTDAANCKAHPRPRSRRRSPTQQSNLCFRAAADDAGVAYHWHSDRALTNHLPRLMTFFRTGH